MKTSLILPGSRLYDTEIIVSPFTVNQVAELMSLAETQNTTPQNLFRILDENLNIPVKSLYEDDLSFLMWWFRFNTFIGIPKVLTYECPHCNETNQVEVSSKIISENVLSVNPDYKKEGVEVQLSDSRKVRMKLLTLKDIEEVDNYVADILEDTRESTRLMCLVIQGMDPELDIHTKYTKYCKEDSKEKLTPAEFYNANKFYQEYKFGVKPFFDFKCTNPKCEKLVRLPLEVSLSDFFPDLYSY